MSSSLLLCAVKSYLEVLNKPAWMEKAHTSIEEAFKESAQLLYGQPDVVRTPMFGKLISLALLNGLPHVADHISVRGAKEILVSVLRKFDAELEDALAHPNVRPLETCGKVREVAVDKYINELRGLAAAPTAPAD